MRRELCAIILNELERQARPMLKGIPHHKKRARIKLFVQGQYLRMGGPLNRELTPYFHDSVPEDECDKLAEADLDVLIGIAAKLGYELDLSWKRK
jgi:hypothetical protein